MKVKRSVFIATTVALSVAIVVLGTAGILLYNQNERHVLMLENTYEQSFYDLIRGVEDIDVRLKKVDVASGRELQAELLTDVWRLADVAESNLATLSHSDTVIEKTAKLLNQLGDYSKYLADVTRMRPLNADEKAAIRSLRKNCDAVWQELTTILDSLDNGYSFVDDGADSESMWSQTFRELEETSIDYPTLIYDGPFSDSVQNREPKGRGEKILTTTGLNYVRKILKGYVDADEIEYVGKTDGRLTTLNYRASGVVVQLSECGKLISMSAASEVGERTISTQEAEKTALEFPENAGFYGVSAVWVSYYYDNAYFNFACVHDGVIAMTDLIKVKVSLATGKVVGVDAQAHFYCCTERENLAPSVSEEEVLAGVPSSLELEHIRLVLIPKGTSERLAYEVYGTIDGQKYFFYYDAETGKEIDVLIVIDSEQGLAM